MISITHNFKDYEAANGYLSLDIDLLKIIPYMLEWCNKNSLPFIITRGLSENIQGVSKTDTHPEGRAIDVSIKHWPADKIVEFEKYWNAHGFCKSYGAFSNDDGIQRLVKFHNGTGPHIHIQTKRKV